MKRGKMTLIKKEKKEMKIGKKGKNKTEEKKTEGMKVIKKKPKLTQIGRRLSALRGPEPRVEFRPLSALLR